jgi:hypothetical protein
MEPENCAASVGSIRPTGPLPISPDIVVRFRTGNGDLICAPLQAKPSYQNDTAPAAIREPSGAGHKSGFVEP